MIWQLIDTFNKVESLWQACVLLRYPESQRSLRSFFFRNRILFLSNQISYTVEIAAWRKYARTRALSVTNHEGIWVSRLELKGMFIYRFVIYGINGLHKNFYRKQLSYVIDLERWCLIFWLDFRFSSSMSFKNSWIFSM